MSCIINIETSTDVCSVSASQDGAVIFNEEDREGPNHAVKLGVFVDEALSFIESHAIPLDAVAVSSGKVSAMAVTSNSSAFLPWNCCAFLYCCARRLKRMRCCVR